MFNIMAAKTASNIPFLARCRCFQKPKGGISFKLPMSDATEGGGNLPPSSLPLSINGGNNSADANNGYAIGSPGLGAAQFLTPVGSHNDQGMLRQFSWSGRHSSQNISPGEASVNSLELEAVSACQELQFAVKDILISELLPHTNDLIFLNVTTLEDRAYCIELTQKGWRICSLRHDSMNGDYNRLDLHTRYFDSIQALMDTVSPSYREKFGNALTERLHELQRIDDRDRFARHQLSHDIIREESPPRF